MGDIDMCGPKGYGFSAISVINRVWLFIGMLLKRGYYRQKSSPQIMFDIGLN